MHRIWSRFWRRSLLARVVLSTLIVTVLASSAVGWFVISHVREGLLAHRVSAAIAESETEVAEAKARLAAASGVDRDAGGQRRDLIEPIIQH